MDRYKEIGIDSLCYAQGLLVTNEAVQSINDDLHDEIMKNLQKKVRELDNDAWMFTSSSSSSSSLDKLDSGQQPPPSNRSNIHRL
ncbi:hypothetical protein SAMD00019534_079550, partial [Acytostelium subglobosum LB1]|uniref:hypothetical protein n=1 Tax=Acytostelium subglobosum LB1 TaxID=1410327 RepID=UPI0006450A1B